MSHDARLRPPLRLLALGSLALLSLGFGARAAWRRLEPSTAPAANGSAREEARAAQPFHYDCGLLSPGEEVRFALPIVNDLDRPLRIVGADVSCGCLKLDDVPASVPARGRADVATRLQVTSQTGYIAQRAAVATDDPARPQLDYRVTAAVRGARFEPRDMHLGHVPAGEASRREMTVVVLGLPATKFVRAESDNPRIRVAFAGNPFTRRTERPYGPELCRKLEVVVGDDAPPGPLRATATIGIETPEPRTLRCTVTADVAGPVRCVPGQVLYPGIEPGRRYVQSVRLMAPPGRAPGPDGVELRCEPGSLTAAFDRSSASGDVIRVTLSVPGTAAGVIRGTIVGRVDAGELFRIPVLALPRPASGESK